MKRQIKNKAWGILPLALLTVMASCSGSGDMPENNKGGDSNQEEPEVITRMELSAEGRKASEQLGNFYAGFTAEVCGYIDAEQKEGSFVISPLSASIVLGMSDGTRSLRRLAE